MGNNRPWKLAERVAAILCWGGARRALGFTLSEMAGRPVLSLAVTHASGCTSAFPAERSRVRLFEEIRDTEYGNSSG